MSPEQARRLTPGVYRNRDDHQKDRSRRGSANWVGILHDQFDPILGRQSDPCPAHAVIHPENGRAASGGIRTAPAPNRSSYVSVRNCMPENQRRQAFSTPDIKNRSGQKPGLPVRHIPQVTKEIQGFRDPCDPRAREIPYSIKGTEFAEDHREPSRPGAVPAGGLVWNLDSARILRRNSQSAEDWMAQDELSGRMTLCGEMGTLAPRRTVGSHRA